jgi:uncharacterized protein with FMN-binding domain
MRRIAVAVMSTISGLVLLFSYHTSLNQNDVALPVTPAGGTTTDSGSTGAGDTQTSGGTSADDSGSDDTATPAPSASASESADSSSGDQKTSSGTFTGEVAQTRWGPVQVQITIKNGKITAAQAVQYPNGNGRDQEINAYAVPALNQATVSAQSAQIDALSGATVTSDGYIQSLQSAIDKAGL